MRDIRKAAGGAGIHKIPAFTYIHMYIHTAYASRPLLRPHEINGTLHTYMYLYVCVFASNMNPELCVQGVAGISIF